MAQVSPVASASVLERGTKISMPSGTKDIFSQVMATSSLRRKAPKKPICSNALSRMLMSDGLAESRMTSVVNCSTERIWAFSAGWP